MLKNVIFASRNCLSNRTLDMTLEWPRIQQRTFVKGLTGSLERPPDPLQHAMVHPVVHSLLAFPLDVPLIFPLSVIIRQSHVCSNLTNVSAQLHPFVGISLYFKTTTKDGLLFFLASEGQDEFVAIQLRAGRPWFLFDPQGRSS